MSEVNGSLAFISTILLFLSLTIALYQSKIGSNPLA